MPAVAFSLFLWNGPEIVDRVLGAPYYMESQARGLAEYHAIPERQWEIGSWLL